jgi:hypothetical protein
MCLRLCLSQALVKLRAHQALVDNDFVLPFLIEIVKVVDGERAQFGRAICRADAFQVVV